MAKKNEKEVMKYDSEDMLRSLLSEREILYEKIKSSGGEIPEEFDSAERAVQKKIDDYGFVNEFFKREIAQIENDYAPFEKVVNIGKQKVKNLEAQLKRFKEITCDIIEAFGLEGGRDGKKRLEGNYFWIKSQYKEEVKLKKDADIEKIPDEFKTVIIELPMAEYKDFYSHLEIKEVKLTEKLPDEFLEKTAKKSVTFFENTSKELEIHGNENR